jgi:antitoxin (DNA-binding transcriptional repressor) of toxin-antitoxin stability system
MTQLRIDVDDLSRDLDAALARLKAGDQVLIERGGRVVACLAPGAEAPEATADGTTHGRGTLASFLETRRQAGRWPDEDYDAFIRDVEAARDWLNQPPTSLWD